jgi:hypothetical protein
MGVANLAVDPGDVTRSIIMMVRRRPGALYLDLETDLHDLGRWHLEVRRLKIGVEVHCREQGFASRQEHSKARA